MVATANSNFTIDCPTNLTDQVVWYKTINKTGFYNLNLTSRINVTNNSKRLIFSDVFLADEEYYGCGFNETNNLIRIVNKYLMYVRVLPTMRITLDNIVINQTDTINMVNSFSNQLYKIGCISFNSKPIAILSVYDSQTLTPLSTVDNSISSNICSPNGLCTTLLSVDFRFDNRTIFDNIKSLTCEATSSDLTVNMSVKTSRNTVVRSLLPSKLISWFLLK